jgi:hypothetical protein
MFGSQLSIWQWGGAVVSKFGDPISFPSTFTALGTGNFAGYSVLFRDSATDSLVAWKLDGASFVDARTVPGTTTTDPARRAVVATGDLDGDGITDVLWQDGTTHEYGVWIMDDGPAVRAEAKMRQYGGSPPPFTGGRDVSWKVVGIGDFDGDGMGDILWQNKSSSSVSIWHMTYFGQPGIPVGSVVDYPNFETQSALPLTDDIVAIGDFDGDSVTDVAWRNGNGDIVVTLTSSARQYTNDGPTIDVKASGVAASSLPSTLAVIGTGDFDGNGRTDILFRNTNDGSVQAWLMNGTQVGVRGAPLGGTGSFSRTASSPLGSIAHAPTPR